MTYALIQFSCIIILLGITHCLQVIPERANVTFCNPKYIGFCTFTIKRYGRKSGYYLNLEGRILQTWNNNITAHFIFHEYLHNEYRRSFIEFHYKLCDMINKEPYFGAMLAKKGVGCPVQGGEYHLMNMTFPTENFPNVFPFEKGRVDCELTQTDTGEIIGRGYVEAVFKAKKKSKS